MKIRFLILFLGLVSCSEPSRLESQSPPVNFNEFISTVELPAEMWLCGEKIPLEIPEVKERAERELYILLQQPGQVVLYLKRSARYFPMFERVIREYNMPGDLKYLAVAESALYQARSSRGAQGMWQFMEATGENMGLVINDYVDERQHPEKSTYAAMKYLKEGYEQHGSWMLTLAGYNRGHTGIARDMDFQDGGDYFDLFLNSETSRFIFRIAIIKELMENPAMYGFNLNSSQVYMPYNAKKVLVKTSIANISDWAKENGTTYKFVKLLNPWILQHRLPEPPSGQQWEILIPE